jgi:hypothetical protein
LQKSENMPRPRPRRGGLRVRASAESRVDSKKRVAGALLCALFVFGGVFGAAIQLMSGKLPLSVNKPRTPRS